MPLLLAAALGGCVPDAPSSLVGVAPLPDPPVGVTATPMSPTRIDVAWSPPPAGADGIEGYRVYRDDELIASVSDTRVTDADLTPATDYRYAVSAVDTADQEGDRSEVVPARTLDAAPLPAPRDETPPTRPGDLTATAVSGTQVNLAWDTADDPESGVAGYRVYRDGTAISTVAAGDDPSFADTGLEPFTGYTYEVSALNGDDVEGPRSEPVTVRTPDESPPSEPTGLSADVVSLFEVELEWEDASDPESGISTYHVYRDGVLRGTSDNARFTDRDLVPWVTYSYVVTAVNGQGLEGPPSDPVAVRTISGGPRDGGSGDDGDDGGGEGAADDDDDDDGDDG